jgi:hypothetical protein
VIGIDQSAGGDQEQGRRRRLRHGSLDPSKGSSRRSVPPDSSPEQSAVAPGRHGLA